MKKILSIIGAISLIGTSTTSLVACNISHEYTPEQLKELKEKNKINTANQEIRDNLEWIAPQEKAFNELDNKYYYVVWKGYKKDNWRIVKFQNNEYSKVEIDTYNNVETKKNSLSMYKDLYISNDTIFNIKARLWLRDDGTYFKSVYRWNLTTQEPDLIIDDNGNLKVKGE